MGRIAWKRESRPVFALPPAESPSSRQVQPEKSNTRPTRPISTPLSELKPVTYFNVDDNDSVPFLLETPQQNK
jgi:hypothetical protein